MVCYQFAGHIQIRVCRKVHTKEHGHAIVLDAGCLTLEDVKGTRALDKTETVDEQLRILIGCSIHHSRAAESLVTFDLVTVDRQCHLIPWIGFVIRNLSCFEAIDLRPVDTVITTLQVCRDLRLEGVVNRVAIVAHQVNLLVGT